jgi:phosphorylcholine metabolism protein LicD
MLKRKRLKNSRNSAKNKSKTRLRKTNQNKLYATIITLQDTETGKEKGYRNKALGTEIKVEILRVDPRQKDEEISTTMSKATRMLLASS